MGPPRHGPPRCGRAVGDGRDAEFAASGTVITFRGFLAAYEEGRDEDPAPRRDGRPPSAGCPSWPRATRSTRRELTADGHETSPPPRYTEATLVKALEERGIGRPSTYASTICTIQDRGYVIKQGLGAGADLARVRGDPLLEEHFAGWSTTTSPPPWRTDLDAIAAGEEEPVAWLRRFYFGDRRADAAGSALRPDRHGDQGLKPLVDDLGEIDAREINSIPIGDGIMLRVGRYGPVPGGAGEDGDEAASGPSVPDDLAPDELTVAKARELLETQADGDRVLGHDPDTGRTIVAKDGRYGPYVTEVLPERRPEERPRTRANRARLAVQVHGRCDT